MKSLFTQNHNVGSPYSGLRAIHLQRDLSEVADLIELCFSSSLDKDGRRYIEQMRAAASNNSTLGVYGRIGQALAGYVWLEKNRIVGNVHLVPANAMGQRSYLIANLAVHPEFRQRGIAKKLTLKALEHVQARRVRSVWLQVNELNDAANHLYHSLGFVEKARRTTWHSGTGVEAQSKTNSLNVGPRKPGDWPQQQDCLKLNYPPEVTWNLPIKLPAFRPGLSGSFFRWSSDMQVKQWSVRENRQHIGSLVWQRSQSMADWLWLAFSPQNEGAALSVGLQHVCQQLGKRRLLAVNYPAGRAIEALHSAGFLPQLTLIWMHKQI